MSSKKCINIFLKFHISIHTETWSLSYVFEWCVDEEEATFKVTAATNGWIGIVFSTDLFIA